jgi:hypothetical protein
MIEKLNPFYWWVLRSFEREVEWLLRSGMTPDRARYAAMATVVAHAPVGAATAFHWIETYLINTTHQQQRALR